MMRIFRLFSFFFASAFCLASFGYAVLNLITPETRIFAALYRMFLYHDKHPYQYIAVVAFTYACVATPIARLWPRVQGMRRFGVIVGIILISIVVASIPGGILWKIHDMQAGWFTKGDQFWSDLFWGASTGLQLGWLIVGLSIPYNLIGLVLGYIITNHGLKIARSAQ